MYLIEKCKKLKHISRSSTYVIVVRMFTRCYSILVGFIVLKLNGELLEKIVLVRIF